MHCPGSRRARNRRVPRLLLATLACTGAGCSDDSPADNDAGASGVLDHTEAWFVETAAAANLHFEHVSGHRDEYLFPEIMAGGAAVFDMDGDGDLDVYFVQGGSLRDLADVHQPSNRLYRNRGDGTFDDVTDESGAGDRGYGMGVATGDYDRDGDLDLYITNVGPNVLLSNNGDGSFRDVTSETGAGDPGWGASAAFVDYDHDGFLDIFVVNYVGWSFDTELQCSGPSGLPDYCNPNAYRAPAPDVLYHNNGDGTFSDVSAAAGLRAAFGNGLGVVCGDFNLDGAIDIFVANDQMANQLWQNQGDGTFRDVAGITGCALDNRGEPKAGMGVHAADIDDDDDLDLLVGNLTAQSDSFFRNEGSYFVDDTASVGLGLASRRFTRFGLAMLDFNNDGWRDLYEVNGRVSRPNTPKLWSTDIYAEPNMLFAGQAGGRFKEVRPYGGTARDLIAASRGAAFGDLDGDGGVDIVVVNRDHRAYLLRNVVPNRGHWIMFDVRDEYGSHAIGATLNLTVAQRTLRRDVRTAYSYCVANDPRIHVGLGTHNRVEAVTVHWTDGAVERFGDFEADKVVSLRRGQGALDGTGP